MDYTTLARVRLEAGISDTADDALLSSLITSASRWLDRALTGVPSPASDNYLLSETVALETLYGQIDKDGNVYVVPHKPIVSSVASMQWRPNPMTGWVGVDTNQGLFIDGNRVTAFNAALVQGTRGKVQIQMTYAGGLATTTAGLPDDILEDTAVMTIRVYRENKTGLTDSMGVAELGTATYTKAVPVRLQEWIQSYKRVVPW